MLGNIPTYFLLSLIVQIILVDVSLVSSVTKENNYNYAIANSVANAIARGANGKLTEKAVEEAFQNCDKYIKDRRTLEEALVKKGRVIRTRDRKADPSLNRMRRSDPLAHDREAAQLPFEEASLRLCEKFDLSRDEVNQDLNTAPMNGDLASSYRENCEQVVGTSNCDRNARYRTADGQCNNLQNPTWGSTSACQQRILPAYYTRNSEFRRSVDGNPLPPPRRLSLNLHYHFHAPTDIITHMYMFFGQLLDHDITLTPFSTTIDNLPIECCPPESETHPQCAPILVSNNDPFYSQFGVRCLNFVRSVICPTCTLGARQHMNQVTAFIDGSFVYGNSVNDTNSLRMNDGSGRLRIQRSNFGDLLPASPNPQDDQCSFPETNDICFQAGDARANQHTVLTSLHTIFMREHNRLANGLRQVNPRWSEERLFQEARRIIGAMMQVITYKEYLPITIGDHVMSRFKLWMGDNTRYDSDMNPTMQSEFTTAGFRLHTLINGVVANSPLNSTGGRRFLRNEFFQPFDLYNGLIDPLLRGASNSPSQVFDRHMVPDVTNFLYRVRGNQTGLDLAAININRGRDHGIPPYVAMVRYCSLEKIIIRSFRDLVDEGLMTYENANALQRNYRYVEDIDLWPGIIMERPNNGVVVSPTAACIIGLQFEKLKYGDRFYLEHANQAGSFSYYQLRELRRVTLSSIICLNTRNTCNLPRNAMLYSSRNNPMIDCNYVKGIDLSYWRE